MTLLVLVPKVLHQWQDLYVWRGILFGICCIAIPLVVTKNKAALLLAALGYFVIRLGIAGVFWAIKHL